ncbi:MAG: MarR family winged helix-turn-helix transcriptional regulator [Actinophytocola sp.]|uniref:MarR family winged helix-turn-helix transcriptional regulator n=1 Tax=Actinophytocola sp. TaxID=1872138 RepID=UPI003D6A975B
MNTVPEDQRARRRVANEVLNALRDVNGHFTVLNHQVGARASLRHVDLSCLDQIARYGPIGPGALAKRVGMHPATMTGILDRLERSGWIARERDPDDRRAVVVRTLPDRGVELYRLYTGMRAAMDEICAGYDVEQLELLVGFLNQISDAGERAAAELAD